MQKLWRLIPLVAVVALGSDCSKFGEPDESSFRTIMVKDNGFDPQVLNTVPHPTLVQWVWADDNVYDHNITFDSAQVAQAGGWLINSPTQHSGTFQFQFGVAGAFEYHCTIHPEMTGTINVRPNVCENGCPIFP